MILSIGLELILVRSTQYSDCGTVTYFLYYITVSTYCQDVVHFTIDHLSLHYSQRTTLRSGVG